MLLRTYLLEVDNTEAKFYVLSFPSETICILCYRSWRSVCLNGLQTPAILAVLNTIWFSMAICHNFRAKWHRRVEIPPPPPVIYVLDYCNIVRSNKHWLNCSSNDEPIAVKNVLSLSSPIIYVHPHLLGTPVPLDHLVFLVCPHAVLEASVVTKISPVKDRYCPSLAESYVSFHHICFGTPCDPNHL